MNTQATARWAIGLVICLMLGAILGFTVLAGGAADASCEGQDTGPVAASGEPPLVQIYIDAANRYGLGAVGYAYLAAINKRETSFGTNMAHSPPAPAEGWMAFEPATWSMYGVAIGHPGAADPFNPYDAIFAAARLLKADGAPQNWAGAVFGYNHAGWYVREVTAIERTFVGAGGLSTLKDAIREDWGGRQPTGPSEMPLTTPISIGAGAPPATDGSGCCPAAPIPASTTIATRASSTNPSPTARGARAHRRATSTTAPTPPRTVTQPPMAGCDAAGLVLDVRPVPGRVAVIMPRSGIARPPMQAPEQVQAMIDAGDRLLHFDYQWGGGHADLPSSDNQTHPHPEGGDRPGDNGFPGYDCSGSTAYVLAGGGLLESVAGIDPRSSSAAIPASSAMAAWGQPGPGHWVTWFADSGHVYIEVAGVYLDTAAGIRRLPNPPSTGPRWVPGPRNGAMSPDSDLPDPDPFVPRHPQGL